MLLEENQVFISYSHEDKKWLEQFKTMLKPLTQNKSINLWDDTMIPTGAIREDEIRTALDSARVAVLMVSPNFLASDFIRNNQLIPLLRYAEEKRLTIFWIYISDCLYTETDINQYQAAHDISQPLDQLTPSDVKKVLKEIAKNIKNEIEKPLKNKDLQFEEIGYEIPLFLLVWLKDNIRLYSSHPLSLESVEENVSQSVRNYMYKMEGS